MQKIELLIISYFKELMKLAADVKICNCGIARTEFNTPDLGVFFCNLNIRQANLEIIFVVIFYII